MITQLDNIAWSKELVTGNAQFIEVGGSASPPVDPTIYLVSQVRADNTFAIFKSKAAPPLPAPGYAFDITATYTFPVVNGKPNTSFDPVITYDPNTQNIYILGTQDNATGEGIDVLLFTYSTGNDVLSQPVTLITASYVRDCYDICMLGSHQFIAIAVTNPANIGQTPTVSEVTSIAISGGVANVTANNSYVAGQKVTFSGLQNATFLNGKTVTVASSDGVHFTGTFSTPPADYTQTGYESGYATWFLGHSLLALDISMGSIVTVTSLDNSSFRSGNNFGAVSAYSPDGLNIEVYYESHPKLVTYADQTFNINLAAYSSASSTWSIDLLKTFTGRYADSRLTVIPSGTTRTLLQQYYSQLVHQNSLVGNLLMGYYDGTTWTFHVTPGSSASSYIQGTLSLASNGAYVSYIAEPTYSIRGHWSPEVKTYNVGDRVSYNSNDYILTSAVSYHYKGAFVPLSSYVAADVVRVTLPTNPVSYAYYTANNSISVASTSPVLDSIDWNATPTPDVDSRFTPAPTSWPLKTSSLDVSNFNLSDIPGFYNNLNFTWLRGSKTVLDSGSKWGIVGEIEGSTTSGATFVSAYNVPPVARISPNGVVSLLRGVPLTFSAAGTNDGDNDSVRYQWVYSPYNSYVSLTPDTGSGATATMLVSRSIGGGATSFTVAVVAVDYSGSAPFHPPMNVTGITVANNVLTVETDGLISLAVGQEVFLYGLTNAAFLDAEVVTVTGIPTSSTFTADFINADYSSADTGSAISNAQFAVATVNVPLNNAPTIDFTHDGITHSPVTLPIVSPRNSTVSLHPTFTGVSDADDQTTYTWTQVSGTTIPASQILSGVNSPYLQFTTNGVLIQGDELVWSLTVNDGVNSPATGTVTFSVPAIPFSAGVDTLRLSRSLRSGNIAQRNTVQSYSPLNVTSTYSNFNNIKRSSILTGADRYLLISPASVNVYDGTENLNLLSKFYVPTGSAVVDAVQTENDTTIVLDASSKLYRYSTAPFINSDNPNVTIDLTSITSMSFNKVFTTFSYGNVRVVILTGSDGCLLLQIRNTDFQVQGALSMTVGAGLVYGVDNVQFVRAVNVESLHSGKLLIGTVESLVANITNISITYNTVNFTAVNNFVIGQVVKLSGIVNASFLNGLTATVIRATSSTFSISFQHADYASTAEPSSAVATTGGKTFETLIDLSHGQVIGTWDASKLTNQFVTTGEVLFEPSDTYSGTPTAPVLNMVKNQGAVTGRPGYVNIAFSWTPDRPDLITSYNLELSQDNVNWAITSVNSGYIEAVALPTPVGQAFTARIKAFSVDGVSPYSNVISFHT